jgi:hypothetical protein
MIDVLRQLQSRPVLELHRADYKLYLTSLRMDPTIWIRVYKLGIKPAAWDFVTKRSTAFSTTLLREAAQYLDLFFPL